MLTGDVLSISVSKEDELSDKDCRGKLKSILQQYCILLDQHRSDFPVSVLLPLGKTMPLPPTPSILSAEKLMSTASKFLATIKTVIKH